MKKEEVKVRENLTMSNVDESTIIRIGENPLEEGELSVMEVFQKVEMLTSNCSVDLYNKFMEQSKISHKSEKNIIDNPRDLMENARNNLLIVLKEYSEELVNSITDYHSFISYIRVLGKDLHDVTFSSTLIDEAITRINKDSEIYLLLMLIDDELVSFADAELKKVIETLLPYVKHDMEYKLLFKILEKFIDDKQWGKQLLQKINVV